MRKILPIVHYEYKMLSRRFATWGVLVAATVISLLDNFPSISNLDRLEFLSQPDYFVFRIMSLSGLLLVFGLMFLLSDRFRIDIKTGVKPLFMAAPIKKSQYINAKLFAGFLYAITMIILYLTVCLIIYIMFSPARNSISEYLAPLGKVIVISVIPVSFFIGFCAIALPAILDIRLFYFVISIIFIINAITVGSAEKIPFYLVFGDLVKLIWQHPKFPFNDTNSMIANLFFLIGCGLVSWALLFLRRRFWRNE